MKQLLVIAALFLLIGCQPAEVFDTVAGTDFATVPITTQEVTTAIQTATPGVVSGIATGQLAIVAVAIFNGIWALIKTRRAKTATGALGAVVTSVDANSATAVATQAKALAAVAGTNVAKLLKDTVNALNVNVLKDK